MPSRTSDSPSSNGSSKRSFLSRALSSKASGRSGRSASNGSSPGLEGLPGLTLPPNGSTRRLSIAPLPPSLTDESPLPSPSSSSAPPLPTRSASSTSISSVTSSSSAGGGSAKTRGRRFSLYDPANPIFPSPPRSRENSAASSQNGWHPNHTPSSSSSRYPPASSYLPDATRSPFSSHASPPPPPTHLTYLRAERSASSSSPASASAAKSEDFLSAPVVLYAPQTTGTGQMDELVDGLRRARSKSSMKKGKERATEREREREVGASSGSAPEEGENERRRRRRQHRREDSSALEDWSSMRSATRAARSRETSAALSDISFASMRAGPSDAQLCVPVPEPVDEDDLTGAPSMARQETLKALERPWMAGLVSSSATAGAAAGSAKSIEEIVGQYKGQLREAATGTGRLARRPSAASGMGEGGQREGGAEPPPLPPEVQVREAEENSRAALEDFTFPPSFPPASTPRRQQNYGATLAPPAGDSPPLPYGNFPSPPHLSSPPSPSVSNSLPPTPTRIKTIEEIIAEHAGPSFLANRKPSSSAPPLSPSSTTSVPPLAVASSTEDHTARRDREESVQSSSSVGTESSLDSLNEELRLAAQAQQAASKRNGVEEEDEATPRLLQHARSFSSRPPRSPSTASGFVSVGDALLHDDETRSVPSSRSGGGASAPPTPRISSPKLLGEPDSLAAEVELARLLKSPRLTRLVTLRSGLTVSLADVGAADGHPVLVFLGLGSVRYLVALYDEIAAAFGLRLLCVDRWGLGRTTDVPDAQRGFVEWSAVVEELVSPSCLDLPSFSVLAHSAGAPYAAACATRPGLADKIHGALHLLAPWVSTSADSLSGMYKYLKYVPSGVLKTAQAAEWKMQGWRLGKPPQLVHAPVGYDAKAGRMVGEESSDGYDRRSNDGLAGRGSFSPTLSAGAIKVAELYGPEAGVFVAGPANAANKGKGGGWKLLAGRRSGSGTGEDEGGSPKGSLRSPSMVSKRSSFYANSSTESPSAASSRALTPNGLPLPLRRSSVLSTTSVRSGSPSPTTPTRDDNFYSFPSAPNGAPLSPTRPSASGNGNAALLSPTSTASIPSFSRPSSPAPASASSSIAPSALIDGLLRASHAESLRGGTSDLLVLLERTSTASTGKKGLGFEYRDLRAPVKVWYGDHDDRISLGSIRWLEREITENGKSGECEVKVVEGADHGLMAHGRVMLEVLESIAAEWSSPPSDLC